jgi:hypothetical protein
MKVFKDSDTIYVDEILFMNTDLISYFLNLEAKMICICTKPADYGDLNEFTENGFTIINAPLIEYVL